MKKHVFILAFLVSSTLFLSCVETRDHRTPPPEGLISKADFVPLFADVQLLEAARKQKMIKGDSIDLEVANAYRQIFEKHETSDSLFRMSYLHYFSKPEEMSVIYEEVIDLLSQQESKSRAEAGRGEDE
jgi:hypothetical protein